MAGRQLARHLRNILIRWWHISTRDDVKRKEPQGGSGVTTSADDEETFVLCDEIIDRIYGFFPPPDDHHDRIYQACRALQALGACTLTITVSDSKPCALTLPHSAPSVAISTRSGLTFSAVTPSASRCAFQA